MCAGGFCFLLYSLPSSVSLIVTTVKTQSNTRSLFLVSTKIFQFKIRLRLFYGAFVFSLTLYCYPRNLYVVPTFIWWGRMDYHEGYTFLFLF